MAYIGMIPAERSSDDLGARPLPPLKPPRSIFRRADNGRADSFARGIRRGDARLNERALAWRNRPRLFRYVGICASLVGLSFVIKPSGSQKKPDDLTDRKCPTGDGEAT